MVKGILIGVLVGVIVGYVGASLIAWGDADEKIKIAEKGLKEYQDTVAAIEEKAKKLEEKVQALNEEKEGLHQNIVDLEKQVESMESSRQEEIVRVAEIDQPHQLIAELKEAFPNFRRQPLGTIKMKNPNTGKSVTSFYLPLMLIKSFIEDRYDVLSYIKQKEALGEINLTYESYIAVQDSIIVLKEEKAKAYADGMQYGITKYDSLLADYIKTLKNPPKLEYPNLGSIAIGTAAGLVAGVAAGVILAK